MPYGEVDYKEVFFILLFSGIGIVIVVLLIILCKRCREGSHSSLLNEFYRELGYRDQSQTKYSSYRHSTVSTPWRASAAWDSRPYSLNRQSSLRPPSIVITISNDTPQQNRISVPSVQESMLHVPLSPIQEEEFESMEVKNELSHKK